MNMWYINTTWYFVTTKITGGYMATFGEHIKKLRSERKITLREFCRQTAIDPSNWSKVERGILKPPQDKKVLNQIADTLKIEEGGEEWSTMMDLAAISFIPRNLIDNELLLQQLPVFFRTIRGQRPTEEELEKLLKLIKDS